MVRKDLPTFSIADYVVFGGMLAISMGIGVFHACTGGKQKTSGEFLMADRNMQPWPVAMSLVASFMSAITVLGTPAEHYLFGTMFSLFGITYTLVMIITAELFMPSYYKLGITSAYEYLEIRFKSKLVRILGCATFLVQMVIYMGIAIYAPSLALNAVTGVDLWGSILICGIVCTFYTTIGGMKAVLWTDTFQLLVMISGFLAVIIQASIELGGWTNIMRICNEGGRIEFLNFSVDPRTRHSVFSVIVGGIFTWVAIYGVNQSQVQRYLTCKTYRDAKIAIYLNIPGLALVLALAACCGLSMYAYYKNCDPLTAGYVAAADQLMPFFVMDLLGFLPGLPGVFVSCMFSAALSTISSGLNSLAAVTGEDIIRQIWPSMNETKYTVITKCLALVYGCLSVFMAYVASNLGSVLQAALSIFSLIGGPLLGLFSLGLFFPWANYIGAVVGLSVGMSMSLWMGFGAFIYPPAKPTLPLSVDGCPNITAPFENVTDISTSLSMASTASSYDLQSTTEMATTPQDSYPAIADLYALSYLYFGAVAWCIVIIVGIITSFITGAEKPEELDPRVIAPLADKCCCFLPKRWRRALYCGVRHHEIIEEEKDAAAEEVKIELMNSTSQTGEKDADQKQSKKEAPVYDANL
ncbi:sodium-coupled monocarboxylate transporter 1-like [Ptychodera flava]|uniref:sodium-coupled monocarboxylate transporter 1-like n=1 Tax=Ptychodera flava TaxID=63121 RepID=UPI003969D96A